MERKEYLRNASMRELTAADADRFESPELFQHLLTHGYKLLEAGDLFTVISKWTFEDYGQDRICRSLYKDVDGFFGYDFLRVDWDQLGKDPSINPPKEIAVSFEELISDPELTFLPPNALFISDAGEHYLRTECKIDGKKAAVWAPAEQFEGKWGAAFDGAVRPNITFVMGEERETVTSSSFTDYAFAGPYYNKVFSMSGIDDVLLDAQDRSALTGSDSKTKEDLELV